MNKKILQFIIFALILLGLKTSHLKADEWDDALAEAHNLVRATLRVHNMQSGIEHLGGPFRF